MILFTNLKLWLLFKSNFPHFGCSKFCTPCNFGTMLKWKLEEFLFRMKANSWGGCQVLGISMDIVIKTKDGLSMMNCQPYWWNSQRSPLVSQVVINTQALSEKTLNNDFKRIWMWTFSERENPIQRLAAAGWGTFYGCFLYLTKFSYLNLFTVELKEMCLLNMKTLSSHLWYLFRCASIS